MDSEELNSLPEFELYSLSKIEKKEFFFNRIKNLFKLHYDKSVDFKNMMDASNRGLFEVDSLESFPFLPVRLFKLLTLKSVSDNEVIKTMMSSGTSGQAVSKIYLDKTTSILQTKALSRIITSFIGMARAPMIIIDCESTVKNKIQFSARTAGILGFSMFATQKIFALNDDMSIRFQEIEHFLEKYRDQKILIFGFTFFIYEHFYEKLRQLNKKLNLENGVLIHGGGWKKLVSLSIDSETFRRNLYTVSNLKNIHDYYGMVEQTGSIFMECECGYLHASEYSEIIIRNPNNFQPCGFFEEGIIQVMSILPLSYPGHSLLTEDLGICFGEDDCKCGRKGKYFKVLGRLQNAEIRGCSDTYDFVR